MLCCYRANVVVSVVCGFKITLKFLLMSLICTDVFFCAGGDSTGGETGFLGCVRNLYIQGVQITDIPSGGNFGGVVNGSCSLQDRSDISLSIYFSFRLTVLLSGRHSFCSDS